MTQDSHDPMDILEKLLRSPLEYRHALGVLDPHYREWGPEGKPDCEVIVFGEAPLLVFGPEHSYQLLWGPGAAGAQALVSYLAGREVAVLSVLGETSYRALEPLLGDGRWAVSRNYGVTELQFRPRPSGQVRRLEPGDRGVFDRSCLIHRALQSASAHRDFHSMLRGLTVTCCGAFVDEQLVGFCSAAPICRGVTEISSVAVAQEHRRRGLASGLLTAQAEEAFARGDAVGYYAGSAEDHLDAMLDKLGFRELMSDYRFAPAASRQQWQAWGRPLEASASTSDARWSIGRSPGGAETAAALQVQRERVETWLRRCLGQEQLELLSYRSLQGYSDCELVACETAQGTVVLKRYAPSFVDYSRLGPVGTARKHLLVLRELPALGVPTPRPLGFATQGEEVALAMEWIDTEPLTPAGRLEAAQVLARLHAISLADLSGELADLATRSTPNRGRLGEVSGEPPLRETTLQHGDYFPVNFAARGSAVRILDWDFFAFGDPMWDLAFLLKADSRQEDRERVDIEAVTRAYREVRPFDDARLDWHLACFRTYWRKRDQDG